MERSSCALCTWLALLTVLGIALWCILFWACQFSSKCVLHGFDWAMARPGMLRIFAIAAVLGPVLMLLSYLAALFNCRKPRNDVLERVQM
jgi:hypothetical protein